MVIDKPIATFNRILLIEDDFQDDECVRRTLSLAVEEFSFASAGRLQDAIDLLKRQDFDAALLDLSLPDSFGIDTLLQLHQEFEELPIIVLSGVMDEELAGEAVQRGAEAFLVKGDVTGSELAHAITSAIQRRRLAEQAPNHLG